ncbi:2OG-Fe-II oxygenase [Stereum hirsutum FP-91666 SS1]|uniref:2OG-Fe-II oxygenase n=1 Tax=Stereum hirsutum (strain FP-91666) TaxID=721885 RepID=UPI000444A07D|nr:2OG-Fe-II oxygenase [Stereum hirsutum FP-91666 SS1]EIM86108.1 2OG-Fe-II oxygenase [Stereum hirsutum FP-91666 SS1]
MSADKPLQRPLMFAVERTESTFDEIPLIDLNGASSNDPDLRRQMADSIRDACINVGFFYVTNHGVPDATTSRAHAAAQRFFSLPLASKIALDIHNSSNFKGYTALLGENTDPLNRGDLHEGFDIGWEELFESQSQPATDTESEGAMKGENVWPSEEEIPGFRKAALEYYHAAISLGKYMFPLFALALDLPENFFDDKITRPAAIMRMLYYPPQDGDVSDSTIGIGAHTDYECFTILWQQDGINALQVLNKRGQWIDAVPIPGSLVINLGDQFARWTNDVFKSTKHRATNRTGIERYSMPLFFGTDYNVKLEALESCVSPEFPAKYEVVTAGDYVKSRLEATYAHSKSN